MFDIKMYAKTAKMHAPRYAKKAKVMNAKWHILVFLILPPSYAASTQNMVEQAPMEIPKF